VFENKITVFSSFDIGLYISLLGLKIRIIRKCRSMNAISGLDSDYWQDLNTSGCVENPADPTNDSISCNNHDALRNLVTSSCYFINRNQTT